jgi:hypothetical protein
VVYVISWRRSSRVHQLVSLYLLSLIHTRSGHVLHLLAPPSPIGALPAPELVSIPCVRVTFFHPLALLPLSWANTESPITTCKITWRRIPEDCSLCSQRCEKTQPELHFPQDIRQLSYLKSLVSAEIRFLYVKSKGQKSK